MSTTTTTTTTTSTTSWLSLLAGIISESKRVVSAHSRHFLALSVLFLLPLSSLLISLPSLLFSRSSPSHLLLLYSYFYHHHHHHHHHEDQDTSRPSFPLFQLLSLTLLLLLSLSASASISHSTLHSFFSRPVKLLPSLSSIPSSLLLLLPLYLLLLLPLALFSLPPWAPPLFLLFLLPFPLLLPLSSLERLPFIPALRRSHGLLRGMRRPAFSLHLFFLSAIALLLWGFSLTDIIARGLDPGWTWEEAVPVVAKTVAGTGLLVLLLLYWMVSGAVLYLYCKAVHGELAEEIAEEFAWQYVCLPFDERKVPHIVSVVRQ